jgi:hypothetical protein
VTPEQEEQVRRALSSLSPEGPVPPDVAARLDATLAGLAGSRQPLEPAVDELAEARRRRRWPRLLVAAASVAVLAYGAGSFVTGLQGTGGDAEMATAARDDAGGQSHAGAQEESNAGSEDPSDVADVILRRQLLTAGRVPVRSDSLARDVRERVLMASADAARDPEPTTGLSLGCETPVLGSGDRVAAVRLDGERATLVLRPGSPRSRVAEVYSCDDATDLLARARVDTRRPAP